VTRRLSELLAAVEHRAAETNDGAAPRSAENAASTALVHPAAPTQYDDGTGTSTISLRFDTQMLSRVDAAAERLGISRTEWLHFAAGEFLGDRRQRDRNG
jgi:hypothetical protein